MFFLGKVFKVRGKLHGDEEKPFLEHLEDLRIMVTRVVITLLIATIGSWVFHKQLVDIMSKPVYDVWENRQGKKLPDHISTDRWERIKDVHEKIQFLTPEQRQQFYACLLYTSPSPRDGATSRMPSSA